MIRFYRKIGGRPHEAPRIRAWPLTEKIGVSPPGEPPPESAPDSSVPLTPTLFLTRHARFTPDYTEFTKLLSIFHQLWSRICESSRIHQNQTPIGMSNAAILYIYVYICFMIHKNNNENNPQSHISITMLDIQLLIFTDILWMDWSSFLTHFKDKIITSYLKPLTHRIELL